MPKISAIILSAGFSSRMQQFKPLLPIGNKTVIERSVDLFHSAGLNDVTIVTGHNSSELVSAMKHLKVNWVENKNFADGMFTSVQTGVRNLPACDAFFITPVDIPLVRPQTVRRLISLYNTKIDVLMPVFNGETGHPPLLSSKYIDKILAYDGANGLAGFMDKYAHIDLIPTGDEGTLMDCDYPEDYERLVELYKNKIAPTKQECMELISNVYAVDSHIIAHSVSVTELAVFIAKALRFTEQQITEIEAAGLLHDIIRKEKNHAQAGAQIVFDMGFPRIAEIIKTHMDITVDENTPITDGEILYLADKFISETNVINIKERFENKITEFGAESTAGQAVKRRLDAAISIGYKLEKTSGVSLNTLLSDFASQKMK